MYYKYFKRLFDIFFSSILIVVLFPLMIFQGLKQFSDGLSVTKYPMYATLVGNVVNVILNYV